VPVYGSPPLQVLHVHVTVPLTGTVRDEGVKTLFATVTLFPGGGGGGGGGGGDVE
jgi:hypothetical protein